MSLKVLAAFLAAILLPTTVQAQKFIGDEYLKQLLRLSMPSGAACADKLGTGPNCTYRDDDGQLIAGKTSDGSVSASLTFPDVNPGVATLDGVLVKIAVGFGFTQDQVHACIRAGAHNFALRRREPDYDAVKDIGWREEVAEAVAGKDYKLMCRAWKPDVNHIEILIAVNNAS